MYDHHWGVGYGDMGLGWVLMILLWVLVIGALVWLVTWLVVGQRGRGYRGGAESPPGHPRPSAGPRRDLRGRAREGPRAAHLQAQARRVTYRE